MKRLIAKINEVLKCLLSKNGQGLVEFVLILAFCAGIGIAAREAGFGQALNALFDSEEKPEYETAAIGGVRKIDWGKEVYKGEGSTFSAENAAERLAWDQKSLENLARYFIGKSKNEIKTKILKNGKSADMGWGERGEEVLLGHFKPTADKQGTVFVPTTLNDGDITNIFSWLKGDYNTTRGQVNPNYDGQYRYFVSDYSIGQGWADSAGYNQEIGVRLTLEYDWSDPNNLVVIGANIAIDPKSQYGLFTDRHTLGLNVQIRSDGTVTYNDVGRPFDENIKPTDDWNDTAAGLQNWYGDDVRVQQSIIEKAVSVNSPLDKGSVVTENGNYYVALAEGNYSNLSASGNLVEITNQYYHANTNYMANTTVKPGDIVIKGAAEAYIYTGNTNKKYSAIPESSWLKLSGVSGL